MVGGFDRYFQIARCYRDEGTKPDRQPEFTQVDIEMSFTTKEHIQRLIEGLLRHSWPQTSSGSLHIPFPEMSYKEAIEKYGVDKPDTSFDNLLLNITAFVRESNDFASIFNSTCLTDFGAKAIVFNNSGTLLSKSAEGSLIKVTKEKYPQLSFAVIRIESAGKWRSSLAKKVAESTMQNFNKHLGALEDDLILLGFGPRESLVPCMGKMRLQMANLLEKQGLKLRRDGHHFLWVVDFPLFLPGEEDTNTIESAHHPFTAPRQEDAHLLTTCPLQVRGLHYDLVLNGSEVGGGSIRIHQANLQEYVLKEILKEDPKDLQHLLRALECGAPPHGGIALGLDRLMTILCDGDSIRDVIAFPKSLDGKDLMSRSPSFISSKDKEIYHIRTVDSINEK